MDEKQLIQQFIATFSNTHSQGVELRISSAEVRSFLVSHDSTLSFRSFNKLSGCLGCTTGNLYAYSIPALQGKLGVGAERRSEREFSQERIMTLNWYGSKRSWKSEWEALYQFIHTHYGCSQVVDIFGGSGFLSLLASRTGLFERVILNEANSRLFNYHLCMQNTGAFQRFTERLVELGDVSKETFNILYEDLFSTEGTIAGREGRRQVKRCSIREAVELFVIRHYSYNGQGRWVEGRKKPSAYIEALERTHSLYQGVKLGHLLYKKVLKSYIDSANSLIILDPPYVTETRKQKQSYGLEFSIRQHRHLLQILTKQPLYSKVVLCGYENPLYQRYFSRASQTWHCLRLRRAGRHGEFEGKEHIWVNFEIAEMLDLYSNLFDLVY